MKKYYSYSNVRNPQWLNQAHTYLYCEVNFDHIPDEWVEFSAVPTGHDAMEHTGEIFERCFNGDFGEIAEFVVPTVTEEERLNALRSVRNEALTQNVDPIVTNPLRWGSLTEAKQQEWTDYRQALLDFPSTSTATLEWNDAELGMQWVNLTLPTKPGA